jgi:glycosyltransferase involved in cell wall biosynthesis
MNITILPLSMNGCHWYRNFQPYQEIKRQDLAEVVTIVEDDVIHFQDLVSEAISRADYIVGRFCHNKYIQWIDKYFPGKKVIIDNDDYVFNPNPYGDMYQNYGTREVKHGKEWLWKEGDNFSIKKNVERIKEDLELIKRADVLTVSTPRLKELYKHPNTKIVYNALDLSIWKPYKIEKESKYEFRIGWSGGATHYGDLYTIKNDLEYITKKYSNVKLVISGTVFPPLYKNINKSQLEFYPWIDISAHPYRTILNTLDLAIIPIEKNEFNKCKSCIKWYEFSSIGVPTIATNYPPYSDELPEIALTSNFREKITELIEAKAKRDKISEYGLNWVRENRDIKKIAKDLYNSLC